MRITPAAKDATRKRILSVAQRQFAQRGFDTTTTRDIARAANIAIGTLFNYFPTKESIVDHLVGEACLRTAEQFSANSDPAPQADCTAGNTVAHSGQQLTLEEELFAHIAASLRSLKPLRKYLPALLETTLSPSAHARPADGLSVQTVHLETVGQIVAQHGHHETLSAIGLQLYWTLYTGVLAFWATDKSPRQEDTLALVDQSLAMFVGWLTNHAGADRVAESTTIENER
jgi:AcrR family transcriptional regulator